MILTDERKRKTNIRDGLLKARWIKEKGKKVNVSGTEVEELTRKRYQQHCVDNVTAGKGISVQALVPRALLPWLPVNSISILPEAMVAGGCHPSNPPSEALVLADYIPFLDCPWQIFRSSIPRTRNSLWRRKTVWNSREFASNQFSFRVHKRFKIRTISKRTQLESF